MNRNTLLIIIVTLFGLVALGLIGGYFFLTNTEPTLEVNLEGESGSLAESGIPESPVSTESLTDTVPGIMPRIRHITTTPVAGYDFVDTGRGNYVIWYVDRATGHVFQTATSTMAITRITNTTIPKVYEAYIGRGGAPVILRTHSEVTDNIQTFIGTPTARTNSTSTDPTKELVGFFTSDIISHLSLSPAKDRFFGMTGSTAGVGNVYTSTGRATNTFTHPLKKWIPTWINTNTILMTSAPSAKTLNISYFLNPTTKAFTKLLGPKNGLVVSASPAADNVLFSENRGNALSFGVYDVNTGTETPVTEGTIPDKCVWSKQDTSMVYCGFPKNIPNGIYPDDWYQGKTTFNDTLRSFDANTFQTNTISNFESEVGVAIDTTNLMLSSDENYILFTNKNDLTLWMIEL